MFLTRISRSHLVSLIYPKLQTSDRRNSWKNVVRISTKKCRSVTRGPIHNFCASFKHHGNFESLYLGNRLRYRDNSKSDFNGTIFSTCRMDFDDKIFTFFSLFFHTKNQSAFITFNNLYLNRTKIRNLMILRLTIEENLIHRNINSSNSLIQRKMISRFQMENSRITIGLSAPFLEFIPPRDGEGRIYPRTISGAYFIFSDP